MDTVFEKTDALNRSKQLIDEIKNDINVLVDQYHQDDKKIAFKATDTLLQKLIELTSTLKTSDALTVPDIKKMDPILKEMFSAFENIDYVLISDLMEYELLPLMNYWRKQIVIKGASK